MKQLIEDFKKSKQKKRRMNKEISNPYDVEEEEEDDHHHDEGNNDNERGGSKSHSSIVIITPRGKKKLEKSQILNPILLQEQNLVLNHP